LFSFFSFSFEVHFCGGVLVFQISLCIFREQDSRGSSITFAYPLNIFEFRIFNSNSSFSRFNPRHASSFFPKKKIEILSQTQE